MSANLTINRRLTFDLVCCKTCAPAHTRGLATFLEIEPVEAGDAPTRFYAYLDESGRPWRTTQAAMERYVLSQRRKFHRYLSDQPRRTWRTRWNAVSTLLTGYFFTKKLGVAKQRAAGYRQMRNWYARKGYRKVPLGLAVGHPYRVRVASAMPYILIGPKDDAGDDYMPFRRETKAFGGQGADLDEGRVVKVQAGKQTIKLGIDHGTAFEKLLRLLYAHDLYHGLYRKAIQPSIHSLQISQEMRRVFEVNAERTPKVKEAIDAAADAAKKLTKQCNEKHHATGQYKEWEKAAKEVWSWLKPPAKGKPSRVDRHWTASWHKHDGGFGPLFALGYSLYLLKETHLADDVYASLLKEKVFTLKKTFETRFRVRAKIDPFLTIDDFNPGSSARAWVNAGSGWLHKGLTIATDSMCWYMTQHMAKAVRGADTGITAAYGGMVTMSKRLLGPAALKRLRSVLEDEVRAVNQLAAKSKLKPILRVQTYPDKVDDLFSCLEELGKLSTNKAAFRELPKDLQARYQQACAKIQEEYGAEFTKMGRAKFLAHWASAIRLLSSVYFCWAVLSGDWERGRTHDWTEGEMLRFGLSLVANGCGLASDYLAAFPDGFAKGVKGLFGMEATSEATSASRAVGVSRVMGRIAAFAQLLIAGYDLWCAYEKGDWRGVVSNSFLVVGAGLMLAGLILDGTLFGLPLGLVLNVAGMVLTVVGVLIEAFRPTKSEPELYLRQLLKEKGVDHFLALEDAYVRRRLVKAVESRESYATIPVTAFIVLPKARVRIVNPDVLLGEELQLEVETFRLKKGHELKLEVCAEAIAGSFAKGGSIEYTQTDQWILGDDLKVGAGSVLRTAFTTIGLWARHHATLKKGFMLKPLADRSFRLRVYARGQDSSGDARRPLLSNDSPARVHVKRPSEVLSITEALWSWRQDGRKRVTLNKNVNLKYWKEGSSYHLGTPVYMVMKLQAGKDIFRRLVDAPGLKTTAWSYTWESDWGDDEENWCWGEGDTITQNEKLNNRVWLKLNDKRLNELIPNADEAESMLQVGFEAKLEFKTKTGVVVDDLKPQSQTTKYLQIQRYGNA